MGLDVSIAANAEGFVPTLASLPKDDANTLALQSAYAWALRRLWAILCGLSGLSLLLSLGIGTHSLDRVLESAHFLRNDKINGDSEAGGDL